MFKKPFKTAGQNQLSGKDKKSIKNKLLTIFDTESVQKLFSTHDKIICNKVSGAKMLIYVADEYPLIVDGTGKEDFFPSIYVCSAFEPLTKSLYVNEGVEGYIFNGANLMWPGVRDLSRLGNFKKDDIVTIRSSANEIVGVGAMGCSLDQLKKNPQGNGIAVFVLHYRGDKLWDLGPKKYPEVILKAKQQVNLPKVEEKPQQIPVKVEQKQIQKKQASSQSQQQEQIKPKPKGKKGKKQSDEEYQPPKKAKGKGKKEQKQQQEQEKPQIQKGKGKTTKKQQSDQQKPEPPKAKGKGKKKEESQEQKQIPKAKGKGKKKEQSDEQKPQINKGKGKGKKKEDSDDEKPEPTKHKGKGKNKDQSEEQKIEHVKPKGKGKNKKVQSEQEHQEPITKPKGKNQKAKVSSEDQKIQEPIKGKGKPKRQEKEPAKKQQSEESDGEVDFGNLVHVKKPQRAPAVKAQKKNIQFSDEQDDKKGKKKGGKKGANKKKDSDSENQQAEPVKVVKQQTKPKKLESDESDDDRKNKKGNNKKGKNKKQESSDQQNYQSKIEKKKTNKGKKRAESDEQIEQQQKTQKGPKVEQSKQPEQGTKSSINSHLMDQHFKQAFLNVLKLSKIEAQLPIDSGRFFSDYMVLARSEGVKLEIKDTTYKKLGKFYEQMAKQKIIDFKPAKEKKGQQGSTITKIYWQNEDLKNYLPTIKKMGQKDVQEKVQEFSKQKLKLTKTLQVEYVYKLNEELKKILYKKVINYMPDKSEDQEKEDPTKKDIFLSERDLKEKVQKYINEIAQKQGKQPKQTKQSKDKDKEKKVEKFVTINYKENEFIYNILKNQIEEYEQNLQKEQQMAAHDSEQEEKKKGKKDKNKKSLFRIDRGIIVNKIFKLAHPHYNLIDKATNLNKFKQGVFKGIQLVADKANNKNITKIIGIETFAPANVQPEEIVKQIHGFANQLQLKFASSSTVQNLPGKNAGKEIIIQGNFVDELESLFTTDFGIKKQFITIQNKVGKKKKN